MGVSGTMSSSQIQMDYMKLLVAQLQNQNPLEPMDNNQMASQLTEFSQLEHLESLNSNFASVLKNAERGYATSLVGKEISFVGETEAGDRDVMNGVVEQIYNNVDGRIMLLVGNNIVDLEGVISVKN